jgi:hypothetical protein
VATQVFLQPAASEAARRHFRDTVQNPVDVARIRRFLTAQQERDLHLLLESTSALRVWGVTPGRRGAGSTKWNRLNSGDVGLFARAGRYFAKCRVLGKVRNASLAQQLWPHPEGGQTWECIYFLSALNEIDITYKELNRAAGYDPNKIPMGFDVLTVIRSAPIIETFRLLQFN